MVKLEEVREAEVQLVIEHIALELQTGVGVPAYIIRRLRPLVVLAFDAGYDAAMNRNVEKEASDAPKHLDA